MPHFIIECSEGVKNQKDEVEVLKEVHQVAVQSQLFKEGDIKVRLNSFSTFLVGGEKKDFIHVFASVMEGRSTEQKSKLSKSVVSKLQELFPSVPYVAMNVDDFEKATYCNRNTLK